MESCPASPFVRSAPHALWRGLPRTLRRRLLARATGWVAPKPSPQAGPAAAGIAVAGEFSRASGLGEGARLMAEAAKRLGVPVWTIDLPPPVDGSPEVEATTSEIPPPGVPLVLHVNAPMLPLALLRLPDAVTRNRTIIGYWAWEMPEVPPEWRPAVACVNQVWVRIASSRNAPERGQALPHQNAPVAASSCQSPHQDSLPPNRFRHLRACGGRP